MSPSSFRSDYYDYQLLAQLQLQQQILANQKLILESQLASSFGLSGPGAGHPSYALEALQLQPAVSSGGGGLNALAQSAMMRKNRAAAAGGGGIGLGQPGGGVGGHHRRSSSASNLSGSSFGSLNTPSVIVSTPTEEGTAMTPRVPTPRFTVDVDGVGRFVQVGQSQSQLQQPRRPSQAGSLSKALSGRRQVQSQPGQARSISTSGHYPSSTSTSNNNVNNNNSSGKSPLSLAIVPTPRSFSESGLPSPSLSPFATTFQPLPPSPFPNASPHPNASAYSLSRSPSPSPSLYNNVPVAVAIRSPRGPAPEEELASLNFASRLRKRAIAVLNNRSGGRAVSVGGI